MPKAIVSILLIFFITGCSVIRKESLIDKELIEKDNVSYKQIAESNITNDDFSIIKAEITLFTGTDKEKLIGNIKYSHTGTYLISLRNPSGIEGARVLITSDSIKINDRINKKFYYGSSKYLNQKYGITTDLIPVILGDFVTVDHDQRIINCSKNIALIETVLDGKSLIYNINCSKKRVNNIVINDQINGQSVNIEFKKFENIDNKYIARSISIINNKENEKILLNIEKFEPGLENEIKFIPGRKYEKILLK